MAYGVYDNFLDGTGIPAQLPAANVCLREVAGIYGSLFPAGADFFPTFRVLMDRVDSANAWEQGHARVNITDGQFLIPAVLPDFGGIPHLADRSIGHALGPLAILSYSGFSPQSPDFKRILFLFEHYLAARQLGDDAHDWWEDLQGGCVNSASVLVLVACGKTEINLARDESNLRKIFWLSSVPEILHAMAGHLSSCRLIIGNLGIIKKPDRLLQMVEDIEKSVQRTKLQQKKIKGLF
jgi:hypothetical protein